MSLKHRCNLGVVNVGVSGDDLNDLEGLTCGN